MDVYPILQKIVLTKSVYFKEKQVFSNFYKVLDSLFLTNTLFFVGCNLSDPDIQLILENVTISAKRPSSLCIAV